jgi:hypothetical protein
MIATSRSPATRFRPARISSWCRRWRIRGRCRSWPRRPARRPRRRTSPAVCRVSPSCSKLAVRRMPPRSPEDRRHRGLRPERPRQALHLVKDPQTNGRGASHPDRQARHRVQGRLREEGPAADRRSRSSRMRSWTSAAAGACRSTGQRSAGGLSPPGCDDQRQAHRDHRAPDAEARCASRSRATPGSCGANRSRRSEFEDENNRVEKMGGKPSEAPRCCSASPRRPRRPRAFLSAASFQDTTRVLTEAAPPARVTISAASRRT